MKAVSLFSGAGGFEVGFDSAGIETVLQAESDPWALAVLERHWPTVERVTDVRDVRVGEPAGRSSADELRPSTDVGRGQARPGVSSGVDLVYGGWPCQGNSVAGKRAGLSDERSGLWTEVRRVLRELRPRWFVGENVPGLLSVCSCVACELTRGWAAEHLAERARAGGAGPCRCTECGEGARLRATHSGRDFGHVLADLDDLGYGVAWRIIDARWFGVPQRRRRVLVVGCLGDAARAAAVLAVCQSCGGYPAAGRPARQGPTTATESGARVAGTLGANHGNIKAEHAWTDQFVAAATLTGGGHPGSNIPSRHKEDDENLVIAADLRNGAICEDQAGTLQASGHGASPNNVPHVIGLDDGLAARALLSRASGYRMDLDTETFVVADPISAHEGATYTHEGTGSFRLHNVIQGDTLAMPNQATDIGEDEQEVIAFDWQQTGTGRSRPVRAGDYAGSLQSTSREAVAFKASHYTRGKDSAPSDVYPPLSADADKGDQDPMIQTPMGVRRLTPLECERLQGFPDNWTEQTADGRTIVDSHRYRLMGNAVATVCAQWLGHRLVAVDAMRREQEGA